MKKLVALLLALIMVLSLFAGCAKQEEPAKEEKPAVEETPAVEKEEEAPAEETSNWKEEHPTWLCEEKTTLKVLCYDSMFDGQALPSNDTRFWQFMEEYTNVHIEWETLPMSGYVDVMSTRLASGTETADIIQVYNADLARRSGESGILLDLAPYWDTHFQNTEAYWASKGTDFKTSIQHPSGAVYAIVNGYEPEWGINMFQYNADWLEKVGMEAPTTLDEFDALLEAWAAYGDLNGNGEDDEILLTAGNITELVDAFATAYGMAEYGWNKIWMEVDDNGEVHSRYTSDAMKAMLTHLNEMYEKGYIDAEIANMGDTLTEKITSNRIGVIYQPSGFMVTYGALMAPDDPYGEHYIMGAPLGSEWNGGKGFWGKYIAFGGPTAINAKTEYPELAAKWLDVMYADPYVLTVHMMGFEGETWEYDENGEPQFILDENGRLPSIAPWGCGQIQLCWIQQPIMWQQNGYSYPWYTERHQYLIDNYDHVDSEVPLVGTYTVEEQEMKDAVSADIAAYWSEMHSKFFLGEADIETEWDTYVATLESLGLETYEDVFQSVYERTK